MIENPETKLAEKFAKETAQSFFLTGKAGTGKTTFLRNLLSTTTKNTIVVAPTGVAAINAGGVTIHSMFSLPLTAFIPTNDYVDLNVATNRAVLTKHFKYRKEKRDMLRELDLLVIDEISMVRCDILDAIDFSLRFVRKNQLPFGGVQIIAIGDLYQLSPIVRDNIKPILNEYYDTPYFFSALAWKEVFPITIELQKVYRQSDDLFINILNNIRNGVVKTEDIERLNSNYSSSFERKKEYITLTTHNRTANEINQKELNKLTSSSYKYLAEIDKNFNENAYPVEESIVLKEGAHIMFIRNDAENGKYFNGKLAVVESLNSERIIVKFTDSKELFTLSKETWENKNYTLDRNTNEIKEEVLGSFTQYPIRLAWAITVHKSQGLTFEKAIVDVGQSFAAGQTYVALSRCVSLDGMVLKSKINERNIYVDNRIIAFHKSVMPTDEMERIYENARLEFAIIQLKKLFDFHKVKFEIVDWYDTFFDKEIPEKDSAIMLHKQLLEKSNELLEVQRKFAKQLKVLIYNFNKTNDSTQLLERGDKAIEYYIELIMNGLIKPTHAHIQKMAFKSRVKKYLQNTQLMYDSFWAKVNSLYHAKFMDKSIYQGNVNYKIKDFPIKKTAATAKKNVKGSTYDDTLALYKSGKTIEEIAEIRSMASSTIEGHLAKWIVNGAIDVEDIVAAERVDLILPYFEQQEVISMNEIMRKQELKTSYGELKMILAHFQLINKKEEK